MPELGVAGVGFLGEHRADLVGAAQSAEVTAEAVDRVRRGRPLACWQAQEPLLRGDEEAEIRSRTAGSLRDVVPRRQERRNDGAALDGVIALRPAAGEQ